MMTTYFHSVTEKPGLAPSFPSPGHLLPVPLTHPSAANPIVTDNKTAPLMKDIEDTSKTIFEDRCGHHPRCAKR